MVLVVFVAAAEAGIITSSSALGLFLLTRETGSTWRAVLIAGTGTLGVLVLLEAIPRFLVSQSPERWGLRLSPFMGVFRLVFGLPAAALALPARVLMRVPYLRPRLEQGLESEGDLL